MVCNELVELVTEYLEGTLDGTDRERFTTHLAECPFCGDYVEQVRATVARLGTVDPGALPEATRARLLRAFRGQR
jgi:anti-sigma factor RsiW